MGSFPRSLFFFFFFFACVDDGILGTRRRVPGSRPTERVRQQQRTRAPGQTALGSLSGDVAVWVLLAGSAGKARGEVAKCRVWRLLLCASMKSCFAFFFCSCGCFCSFPKGEGGERVTWSRMSQQEMGARRGQQKRRGQRPGRARRQRRVGEAGGAAGGQSKGSRGSGRTGGIARARGEDGGKTS